MKKLILSAAIILGSFTTFAQTSDSTKSDDSTKSESTKTVATTQTVEEKYSEIKLDEVPEAVKNALLKAYPTAVLDKVFINEKKEYKLQITVGDKVGALYADAAGAWIKK